MSSILAENERVTSIARLVTFVDIDEPDDDAGVPRLSFSARHDAVLADGRRVALLHDRGWSQSTVIFSRKGAPPPRVDRLSLWDYVTREQIEESARSVVGPDEPYSGYTRAEMVEGHWTTLAGTLEQAGVKADAAELKALPHDVELSDRVLARLGDRRCKLA
jgi:hypothetical protein